MSRGRKERTPAQLAVLAQAREKAKIVIAERAKLNALAKKDVTEPVLEDPSEPQPETEPEAPPPPPSESLPVKAPPEPKPSSVSEDPASESEDEEPRPKYRYIHGVGYIKIK